MSVQEKALIRTDGRYPVWLKDAKDGQCVYLLADSDQDTGNICGARATHKINDDGFCIDHIASELSQALLFSALLGDLRRDS